MKKIHFFYFCLAFGFSLSVQSQNIDSLVYVLNNQKLTIEEQILVCKKISAFYIDNDTEKSFEYSEKGLALARKKDDKVMESWFLSGIADCYDAWAKPDTALMYHQEALKLALESDDDKIKTIANSSVGMSYFGEGKYVTALEYYMKALSYSEKVDSKYKMIILGNIGGAYRLLLNNEQAVCYLEQAKEIAEEIDSKYGLMSALYDLGHIALANEESDKALEYMIKVSELSRELSDKQFEILSLQALAYVYSDGFNEAEKAEEYAKESLAIAEDYGVQRLVRYAWIALSDVYLKQKRYKACEDAAWKAWEMDSLSFEQGRGITQNIAVTNALMGNENKAFLFFKKNHKFNMEYISKSLHETIADLEVKYDTEEKELRIAALEKEKTFNTWLGIVGFALLVLAFGVVFLRHQIMIQKRKLAEQHREIAEQRHLLAEQKVRKLEQEKQLIATQSLLEGETVERMRISRDLHDGLGGLLSAVKLNLRDMKISLMDKQDVVRFNNAISILGESIDELRHIAHHMMPESLMRFGLKVSLEDFCGTIPIVHFRYFGKDERLEHNLEVMLYRCTYELVNNALKHANASNINVQLLTDNGFISLTVQDDGIGFDTEHVLSGDGLNNLKARVLAFNGKMNLISVPGEGTEVCIEIE